MDIVKTLHIVGFKNSGKTTLITRWVKLLKSYDYIVSVIKHHGHTSKLAMPDERKDSMQYLLHGADSSLVSGGGYMQQIVSSEVPFSILKQYAMLLSPDFILIEGYKHKRGPKVVIVRNEEEWEKLQQIDDIVLVIGPVKQKLYDQIESREMSDQLNQWLLKWIRT